MSAQGFFEGRFAESLNYGRCDGQELLCLTITLQHRWANDTQTDDITKLKRVENFA